MVPKKHTDEFILHSRPPLVQITSIHPLKHLHRLPRALLKPNELPPQRLPRLRTANLRPAFVPPIPLQIIGARVPHGDSFAVRIPFAQQVGCGLRRDAAVDEQVALAVGARGVLGAPDVHGGDVAHVDKGGAAERGGESGR